ncbi:hypothetical protein [Cytobacillus horneckiae]|uniref:hypothetical protein n=1 Tax=Cytobacillus horneckiae TaxID=549687 RepID=UPI002DBCA527|nr:hypothetical protein [Cytobacillus horneckiae]MEC1157836.1 hypothetical protein [Cytobacillus horneckiae]MED2940730.1 hypothetical protein [Cytobacillus horneckiae]
MIEILIDHSYEDDYFMISEITVNIKDLSEKERIEQLVKKSNLIGSLVDVGNDLKKRIADRLKVDVSLIDFDTNEIDIM